MSDTAVEPTPSKPLRLWPGIIIVALQWLVRFVVPLIIPGAIALGVIGGLVGWLLVVIWWVFLSRAPRFERWGALVLMIIALVLTPRILDRSIVTGMMGMMFYLYVAPVLSLALVAWAVITRRLPSQTRRLSMVATILLACGVFALLRTGGMTGEAASDFHWRWAKTPEERLLAQPEPKSLVPSSAPATVTNMAAAWPGFRGPGRDGIVRGVRIATNWTTSPPVEVWRRPVGPGWSSFAVDGERFYTQEQRGEEEVVSCYKTSTGEPVWSHRDPARFWESNAGAGPRGTPTLSKGRVYACGATGILNALEATDGKLIWSRNAASDTGKKVPGWGFSGSPLVRDDIVIVAMSGALVAYDITDGTLRWLGPTNGWGYSSPHLLTIAGVEQILLLNGLGVVSVSPTNGARLWDYTWKGDGIVQPGLTGDGDVLLGTGSGLGSGAKTGVRRIGIKHESSGWNVDERWTSNGLKPYYNDFVVHKGHAFGFDGSLLACVDLANGERKWKGGRYGYGQLILLADQDLLIVLSEQGDLALLAAATDDFKELGRIPAIKGKTWNHPVLAGDMLLARNSEEMAAFRIALVR